MNIFKFYPTLFLLLAFSLSAAAQNSALYQMNTNAKPIHIEDFEKHKTGDGKKMRSNRFRWGNRYGKLAKRESYLTEAKAFSGDRSLQIKSDEQKKIWMPLSMHSKLMLYIPRNTKAQLVLNYGQSFLYQFENGFANLGKICTYRYPTDEWFELKFLSDPLNFKIDVFVNNELAATHKNISGRSLNVSFESAADSLGSYYVDLVTLLADPKVKKGIPNLFYPRIDSPCNTSEPLHVRYLTKLIEDEIPVEKEFLKDSVNIVLHNKKDAAMFEIYIANLTDQTLHYPRKNGLILIREAKNEKGEWQAIERNFIHRMNDRAIFRFKPNV